MQEDGAGSPVVHEHPRVPDVRRRKPLIFWLRVVDALRVDVGYRWPLEAKRVEGPPSFRWYERLGGEHRVWLQTWRMERKRILSHRPTDPRWGTGGYGPPGAILGSHEQGARQDHLVNSGSRGVGTVLRRYVLALDHP